MKYLVVLLLLLPASALAQSWESTRTTTHDYSCVDADNKVLSGHTRLDEAFEACSNRVLKDGVVRYVSGGRYRIERKTACPTCPTTPPPAVTGSATLSWVAPTQNTDGSPLTDLTGFRIVYGTSPTSLTQSIVLPNPTLRAYVVEGLSPGTHYFAARAVAGTKESANSNMASKVIP